MNSYTPVAQALAAETEAQAVRTGFWQHPFVQDILPFLTSLMMHVGLIVIGFVFFYTFKEVMTRSSRQQFVADQSTIVTDDSMSVVPNPGDNGNGLKIFQDINRDVPDDSLGKSIMAGKDELISELAEGGGINPTSPGSLIGIGGNGIFGKGDRWGPGTGHNGPQAPFGTPGGTGAEGPRGVKFVGMPGVANRIVFICDATGSMMSQFDNLRIELRKAVEGLTPHQAMNVVFFQENAPPPISKLLLPATPQNKQRIYDFVDKYTPKGPTDPIPAIKLALAMNPDLIFFLCDPSDFPDPKAVGDLFKGNLGKACKVNTISFLDENHAGEELLKHISADSGGKFKYVSQEEMGK